MEMKKVALVGLGAIGSVYAIHLTKGLGENFAVVAGGKRAERIRQNGEKLNGELFIPRVVEPGDESFKADLIIFSTKNYHLEQALEDVKSLVYDKTVFLPIINGVSARDRIKAVYKDNTVLYGLCKTDAEKKADGVECTWEGQIQFGEADNTNMTEEVKAIKALFDACNIKNEVHDDMMRDLWHKFMVNVSVNQLSAITGAPYGAFLSIPELNDALHQVMAEVVGLANAKGINLKTEDIDEYIGRMKGSDPNGFSSMAQDVRAQRKTEVDYFAGTMIQYGKEINFPTPWNDRLYLLIKTKEKLYGVK